MHRAPLNDVGVGRSAIQTGGESGEPTSSGWNTEFVFGVVGGDEL